MIDCDSCKEWFHGECVGINQKVKYYICIGCAKRCGYLAPEHYLGNGKTSLDKNFDGNLLRCFTEIKRIDYGRFLQLMQDGIRNVAVYLEELDQMKEIDCRFQDWVHRANQQLECCVSMDAALLEPSHDPWDFY